VTAPTGFGAPPTTAPSFDEHSLNRIGIAEFDWPFAPTLPGPSKCGSVKFPEIDFSELKVDQQKAAGTDKAKTKINGVECNKGSFELHWTRHLDDQALPMLQQLDPGGPRKGVPQEVRHPFFTLVSLQAVLFVGIKVKMAGDHRVATMKWEEWNDPPTAVAGSTTTPTQASEWTPDQGGGVLGSKGPPARVSKGFNPGSAAAPATSPK
jgi:hypothetical protein